MATFCNRGGELCVCISMFPPLNQQQFNEIWQWYRVFKVSLSSISFIKSISQVEESVKILTCTFS